MLYPTKSTTWNPNLTIKNYSGKNCRLSDKFSKISKKPVLMSHVLLSGKFETGRSDLVSVHMLDPLEPVFKST